MGQWGVITAGTECADRGEGTSGGLPCNISRREKAYLRLQKDKDIAMRTKNINPSRLCLNGRSEGNEFVWKDADDTVDSQINPSKSLHLVNGSQGTGERFRC